MTREEAIAVITMNANSIGREGYEFMSSAILEALTILAPEPRTEPPTVEEVGDEEWCFGLDVDGSWNSYRGKSIRQKWNVWRFIAWLPLSALPVKGGV